MSGTGIDSKIVGNQHREDFAAGTPHHQPERVRIALVDDEESVHSLVQKIFNKHAPDWILESHRDGPDALKQISKSPPSAVLMDIALPGCTGIECAKKLKNLLPELPIVMLSGHIDPEVLLSSMMAGSSGCLYKPASAADIVLALQKAMAGSMSLCARAEKTMMECFCLLGKNFEGGQLTDREHEIMTWICQQKTDKQISETLGIHIGTVHAHTSSIFKKLNVHSRTEAIRKIMGVRPPA